MRKLMDTTNLVEEFGMQTRSVVTETDNAAGTFPLGSIKILDANLDWVASTLSREMNAGGVFDAEISPANIEEYFRKFFSDYLPEVPDDLKNKPGSTSDTGLLCNWLLLNAVTPESYVEVGVFVGSSLRMADFALPDADKWAYDLSFRPLKYESESVNYIQNEITRSPPKFNKEGPRLAFFDDHIDPVRRICEAQKMGIEWLIIDDTPSIPNLATYRYPAVPSVSMIMDDSIPDGMLVEWQHARADGTLRYVHDKAYCKQARNLIVGHLEMRDVFGRVGLRGGDKSFVRLKV